MECIPAVVQAVAGDERTVYACFSDGSARRADVSPLIEKGGLFSRLADEEFFTGGITVMNGAVAWGVAGNRDEAKRIDLDPCAMYDKPEVVSDPLEGAA